MYGVLYIIAAYTAWGFLPLYWKSLQRVPPPEILGHRILWSFVFLALLLTFQKRWGEFRRVFSIRRNLQTFLVSALIIGSNWLIYIWAINSGHIVDASLGYFINPLVSVLLGVLILKERMGRWQVVSVILAAVGVIILAFNLGAPPWISLSLALTFGFYGLIRKTARVESLAGLSAETFILLPAVVTYLLILCIRKTGAIGTAPPGIHLLLIGAGVVTAAPLLFFNSGVRKIPLSTVGFLQYLSPTFQLILGVFVYHEPFTSVHKISFGFIWMALAVFTISTARERRQSKLRVKKV
ncbi:MAG: EamA family transporter RarD [Candidatus Aminicenantes bacterium]|nr:EamA family transporter RarD [Candidatus Aminicenantes bacterium]